jgi:hypothetical protein
MSHVLIKSLEREERLIKEAHLAEEKQHWYRAFTLWYKLGEFTSATFCENILFYLAINNLDRLPPKHLHPPQMARKQYNETRDSTWRER